MELVSGERGGERKEGEREHGCPFIGILEKQHGVWK